MCSNDDDDDDDVFLFFDFSIKANYQWRESVTE